ncbi:YbaB/EbfC family nucleoid-associated protein [Dermatobacter hominis]|uniref:YbaB/EbfC family nucleoid-associated protein n=1 Tax=Dermatobacter hominis TaxID=2884263 RepID=UPI001D10C812|nr:YbaB/EbfC family nucleoid-associated protein [Dermatobacter hominis]UDY34186.1 YbaB/EbfC family nucleoid-associated protein [Dermatobacter hominis]
MSGERDQDEAAEAEVVSGEIVPDSDMGGLGGPDLSGLVGGDDLDAGLDLGAMFQMAQDMGARMQEAQEELAATEVEGTAGGGVVSVTLNGHLHLVRVHIDPGAVDPEDLTMLEDLIVAAWSDARDQVAQLQAQADPLGGMGGLGGLGGLLGG